MRTATGPRAERNGSVITVALVDDHAAIRSGLAMILRQHDDIDVVAEAGDGASAITVTRTHQPDVVLMDVRMPGTDGIEATRQIIGTTRSRVLVLTTFDLDEYVFAGLRAGATAGLDWAGPTPPPVDPRWAALGVVRSPTCDWQETMRPCACAT